MFSLTHILLATILVSDAFLLEEKAEEEEEVLKEREKEVFIVTGGFSSQGALSSVEVL